MKQKLFVAALSSFSVISFAQAVAEPDFVGEVVMLKPDNSSLLLEKSTSRIRTAANAGVYMVGIGSVRSKIELEGCCAKTRIKSRDDVKFIVKAVDNNTDPMAIVKVFAFEKNKKIRRAELASMHTFAGAKSNTLKYLPFTAKKYGESSYLITLSEKPVGEYGVTVSNPNNVDEKSTIVSTFAVD